MKKYFFLYGVLLLLICFGCETLETQRDRALGNVYAYYMSELNRLIWERDSKLNDLPQIGPIDIEAINKRLGKPVTILSAQQTGSIDVEAINKAKTEIYNEFYYKKSLLDAKYQSNIQSIQNNYVNRKLEEIQTVNMINAFNQSMYNLNQQIQYNNMINQQQNLQNQMYQLQNQINQNR